MAKDPLIDSWKHFAGQDFRRSSRVKCEVPLLVYGEDSRGKKFVEKTHAIDLNLHGCGFLSRHSCLPGSYVTLRFGGERYKGKDKVVRAQVKRSDPQVSSRRFSRIGVELGIPGNVWSYSPIPPDWSPLLTAPEPPRTPVLVSDDRPVFTPLAPAPPPPISDIDSYQIHLELGPSVSSAPPEPPHGVGQHQIDSAVAASIEKNLEPAIARALSTLDLQTRASMRQLRETAFQREASVPPPARQELDAALNDRLTEIRAHWDLQLDGYLVRMEECVQRTERQAAAAEQRLATARDLIDKMLQDFSRQLEEQVNYAVKRAAQLIAEKAAHSVDHQLVRLTEDAHFVAREINSMVEADSAAARAEMRSALHSVLEDLRAQSEIHAKHLAADARQRVTSALAALDAEHQALYESRRKSIDDEIVQTGAKVTAEFRQSLKAFFYSCLVAAVGTVEEHAHTTLDGLASGIHQPPLPESD
jgi:hypothetical protein